MTPNGSGGEFVQYHHPDRLGTRLVTNAQDTSSFEQVALPFGTALSAESYGGPGNPPDDAYDPTTGKFDPDLPGVDDIDNNGFKNHDLAYRNPSKSPRSVRNADWKIVKTLLVNAPRVRIIDIAFGSRAASGSVYKFFAVNFFTGSTVVRSARL